MKKTLAAVLAAAMALSTASVAMARDYLVDEELGTGSTADLETEIRYGKNVDRLINELGDFEGSELAELVDDGYVSVTAIVTEGSNKLDGKPSITVLRRKTGGSNSQDTAIGNAYTWADNVYDLDGKTLIYKKGAVVKNIPVYSVPTGTGTDVAWKLPEEVVNAGEKDSVTSTLQYMKPTNKDYNTYRTELVNSGYINRNDTLEDNSTSSTAGDKVLRVRFKVSDTYGTGDTTIGMKLRITIKKAFESYNGISYKKGDTYTTDEFKYKAKYGELDDYNRDMQVTLQEVDDRNVKFDASDLYDQIGNDTFTMAFEDTAVFEAKISASQKDLNLYYDLDEKTDVTSAYPNVDFEFITFRGNPSFVNSGSMTFNAIGGKNTTVYTFDGETLNPLNSTYDSTYGTVTVKGIKKLGTFVVASEILEVEDDEDNEPVSSAPIVEESSSQPSSNDGDRNPSTGAC